MTFFFFSITHTETQHNTQGRSKFWAYACSMELNDSLPVFIPKNTPHEQISLWYMMSFWSFRNGLLTHPSRSTYKSPPLEALSDHSANN